MKTVSFDDEAYKDMPDDLYERLKKERIETFGTTKRGRDARR